MNRINDVNLSLQQQADFNERLKTRVQSIKDVASYRKKEDCIPLAKSLAKIPSGSSKSDGNLLGSINLIGDQVWNIQDVLLS